MGRAFEYRKARKLKRWGNMARTFTKIGKEISIAVKAGGPDPDANPRLRVLMQNAKAANMPKENVERAIKKASSKDAGDYKEVVYEGYGPFGIAIVVETATVLSPMCAVISIKPEDRWERPVVFLSCSTTNVCFISNPKRVSRWRISNLK